MNYFKYFCFSWYMLLIVLYVDNYIEKSTKKITENVTQNIMYTFAQDIKLNCGLDLEDFKQSSAELRNYSKLPSPAKKPYPNRLYLLSNPNNHIFTLALMDNSYDTIKHLIFIDFNKTRNMFCKRIYNSNFEIFASLVESDKRYHSIKNYGNSYFFDPGFEIINIMNLALIDC